MEVSGGGDLLISVAKVAVERSGEKNKNHTKYDDPWSPSPHIRPFRTTPLCSKRHKNMRYIKSPNRVDDQSARWKWRCLCAWSM